MFNNLVLFFNANLKILYFTKHYLMVHFAKYNSESVEFQGTKSDKSGLQNQILFSKMEMKKFNKLKARNYRVVEIFLVAEASPAK